MYYTERRPVATPPPLDHRAWPDRKAVPFWSRPLSSTKTSLAGVQSGVFVLALRPRCGPIGPLLLGHRLARPVSRKRRAFALPREFPNSIQSDRVIQARRRFGAAL